MTAMSHRVTAGIRGFALAGVLALGVTSCSAVVPVVPSATSPASERPPSSGSADPGPLDLTATPTEIATGLAAPWSTIFVGDVVLVSERDSGRIVEVTPSGALVEVGVVEGVLARSESGLLGLAVDNENRIYAYSTAVEGNRIQRFTISGEPGSLQLSQPETIIEGIPQAPTHDGGRIAFGPDGMLYATVGDAGDRESSQDPEALTGKILRMTPDGAVPADNPFAGSLVFSLGHRNPQGIGWSADGTMYAAEFGQKTWDELNVIEPGGNYGWPLVEGIAEEPRREDFIDPIAQWATADASPSGMAILGGRAVIANLRGEVLRTVNLATGAEETPVTTYGRLRDVSVGPDGALWVLTNNTDGRGDPRSGDDRLLRFG